MTRNHRDLEHQGPLDASQPQRSRRETNVIEYGGITYVAWVRDGLVWTAANPTRVVLAPRTGGVWTTGQFTTPPASSMTVLAQANKARLLSRTGSQVLLCAQR